MIHEKSREISCLLTVYEMCDALRLPRATYYRQIKGGNREKTKRHSAPRRKLSPEEEEKILKELNSERFCDMAPGEIFHTLLDEGIYYCSQRTMYRVLARNRQNVQRRQREKGKYERPELLATRPNELWSWDITKMKGPRKWTYYYLYKIMDVYSRRVVGWMVAHRESKQLARTLIDETCRRQNIREGQLTLHADRGSSMKSNVVGQLLMDLGVTKTHSRPHVSNDNPYSESLFKTLKYRPDFPEMFNSIEEAREFCVDFFGWYNKSHKHSGIAYLTPDDVHYARVDSVIAKRQAVMEKVFQLYPERFVKGSPVVKKPSEAVWINKPEESADKSKLDVKKVA